jgi:hypothetical protein
MTVQPGGLRSGDRRIGCGCQDGNRRVLSGAVNVPAGLTGVSGQTKAQITSRAQTDKTTRF